MHSHPVAAVGSSASSFAPVISPEAPFSAVTRENQERRGITAYVSTASSYKTLSISVSFFASCNHTPGDLPWLSWSHLAQSRLRRADRLLASSKIDRRACVRVWPNGGLRR
jgi:hypothetical protein